VLQCFTACCSCCVLQCLYVDVINTHSIHVSGCKRDTADFISSQIITIMIKSIIINHVYTIYANVCKRYSIHGSGCKRNNANFISPQSITIIITMIIMIIMYIQFTHRCLVHIQFMSQVAKQTLLISSAHDPLRLLLRLFRCL